MTLAQKATLVVALLRKYPLASILLFSLLLRVFYLLLNNPLWWDSHIYIGLGKYLWSKGEQGVFELFRPLLHPLMLGAGWHYGLSIIAWGKFLDVLFSLLAIFFTYRIGEKVFSRPVAVWGALMISLAPAFLMFTGLLLADPLGLTLALGGTYFFLTRRSSTAIFVSGIFFGLAFLTRFPLGIFLGGALIVMFLSNEGCVHKFKNIFALTLGYVLPFIPYFIFISKFTSHLFAPFLSGAEIVTTATWLYGSGWNYYFREFFLKQPIFLLIFPYLYFIWKEKLFKKQEHLFIVLVIFLGLAYFLYLPRKEPRYLATILPLLALAAGYALWQVYQTLSKSSSPLFKPKSFLILCIIFLLLPLPTLSWENNPSLEKEALQIIEDRNITGTILSSDPFFVSYRDQPLVLFSGMSFAVGVYASQRGKYSFLYLNDCDLVCALEDHSCKKEKETLLKSIADENRIVFTAEVTSKFHAQECKVRMYVPK